MSTARAPAKAARELTYAEQARMIAALRTVIERREGPLQMFETHISYVLVSATRAYKLKKALDAGFLDFGTLARRRRCCTEELRLNRRLAPSLYLGVVAVSGSVDAPALAGAGPVLDWALAMRAFEQDGLWDRMARRGALAASHVDALAASIADFHRDARAAAARSAWGRPAQVRAPMLETLAALEHAGGAAAPRDLRDWEAGEYAALVPVFAQRRRAGRVRECHGDLHLGNIAQIDGRPVAFDCIEFSAALRWIDVASEIAFTAMDLHAHALPALAHRWVDAYLGHSGDYGALRPWRWYFAYRALVRARVAALRGSTRESVHYLELAARCTARPRPALVITHGLAGSGKSTVARALVERLGAVRIRSDVERKRLAGLDALAPSHSPLDGGLYRADASAATYARLMAAAAPALAGGWLVVLDAAFLRREQRELARRLAREHGVPFVILDFEVEPAVLRARVAARSARGGDPSEAGLAVLEAQLARAEPLAPDERAEALACGSDDPQRCGTTLAQRIAAVQ